MDPIKPLNGLTEILRKQIASEVAAKGGARAAGKSTPVQQNQLAQRSSTSALRHKIAEVVASLDPDDPRRKQKVVRIFVENTLSWKFGSELINDPGFSTLVDDVSEALESEAGMIEQLVKED